VYLSFDFLVLFSAAHILSVGQKIGTAFRIPRNENSLELPKIYTMKKQKESITSLPGIALIGLVVTGFSGIFHTFDSGSAVGLIASAISFGVLAVVSFI